MSKELKKIKEFVKHCEKDSEIKDLWHMSLKYKQAKALLSELNRTCEWIQSEDKAITQRLCDEYVDYEYMNVPKFCPNCGGKIEVVK